MCVCKKRNERKDIEHTLPVGFVRGAIAVADLLAGIVVVAQQQQVHCK
jgi:hypothetical protein